MSNIVFFDDVSDEVREAAEEFVAADHTERSGVWPQWMISPPSGNWSLRWPSACCATRPLAATPSTPHPRTRSSPAEAARILDVSRQYVDRLLADGRLPFGHKPGSTHRTIRVVDVERLAAERSRRRASTDAAITALIDGGLDY